MYGEDIRPLRGRSGDENMACELGDEGLRPHMKVYSGSATHTHTHIAELSRQQNTITQVCI